MSWRIGLEAAADPVAPEVASDAKESVLDAASFTVPDVPPAA